MVETPVEKLEPGDEFTADRGETWWCVMNNVDLDVDCECVLSQVDTWYVGQRESFLFMRGDKVTLR